ncbi:hypothetical protein LTS10_003419 [Elasticomyces elasticus]|nr:hypothetical protein LTS10_003419 [Elasticomyces elasticus]
MAGTPVPVVHAMRDSVTSFSLGIILLQVAYQSNRDLMLAAVPMRFVAAIVFHYHGGAWNYVSWYEAGWGALSIGALLL